MTFKSGIDAACKSYSLEGRHFVNAYQTNMTLLGQTRQDLPFTVCSKFQPTVLEGQLCFSINLDKTKKAQPGFQNGLQLIIDPLIVQQKSEKEGGVDHEEHTKTLSFDSSNDEASPARFYLNTLASFSDSREGSYGMSALKKMTATDSFLGLNDNVKECQVEVIKECNARMYIEEVQTRCGCVPWALSTAVKVKPTVSSFCSPSAFSCYSGISWGSYGCRVACTGLYADVFLRTLSRPNSVGE